VGAVPPLAGYRIVALLLWALAGCLEWQHEGLGEPTEVVEATAAYRADMDTIGQFIADCCIRGDGLSVGATDLYETFRSWLEKMGEKETVTQNSFGKALAEKGFKDGRFKTGPQKGRRLWQGIGLSNDPK
jgi:putative DNA primase/helicase